MTELSNAKAALHRNDMEQSPFPLATTVDLVQDVATDCSVVASLCAGTARTERGQARVIQD